MNNLKTIFLVVLTGWIFAVGLTFVMYLNGSDLASSSNRVVQNKESSSNTTSINSTTASCIVTIQSKRYNVEELRKTHSGGDIFICGSDMTDTFFSMHNSRLLQTKMQRYLID